MLGLCTPARSIALVADAHFWLLCAAVNLQKVAKEREERLRWVEYELRVTKEDMQELQVGVTQTPYCSLYHDFSPCKTLVSRLPGCASTTNIAETNVFAFCTNA